MIDESYNSAVCSQNKTDKDNESSPHIDKFVDFDQRIRVGQCHTCLFIYM